MIRAISSGYTFILQTCDSLNMETLGLFIFCQQWSSKLLLHMHLAIPNATDSLVCISVINRYAVTLQSWSKILHNTNWSLASVLSVSVKSYMKFLPWFSAHLISCQSDHRWQNHRILMSTFHALFGKLHQLLCDYLDLLPGFFYLPNTKENLCTFCTYILYGLLKEYLF